MFDSDHDLQAIDCSLACHRGQGRILVLKADGLMQITENNIVAKES